MLDAPGQWRGPLGLGVATVALGIVLSVWPEATLRVLAVVIAIQLLATGLINMVAALASPTADSAVRVLLVVSGIIAVIVGLVCLRAPQQTVALLGLILGLWWTFKGLIEMVRAVSGAVTGARGATFGLGLVTTAAGAFVLLDPHLSFTILLVVVEVWLFAFGFLTIAAALTERSEERRSFSG
jgi:uncharacterized membrane protein HdeD (DUF308 family)